MEEARNEKSLAIGQDEEQKGRHSGSTKREKESPLCCIDGHLSSKNAELEPKYQKYRGRVVLLTDIVKDNSGAFAAFTERGSSASQVTAATVMDVIARLPDCARQAADVVSAYTQVKMEDAPRLLQIPKSECPDILIRLPRHKWPKSWSNIEEPVIPLERNLYGHPTCQIIAGKTNLKTFYWDQDGKKFRTGNAYPRIEGNDYSCRQTSATSK